MGSLALPTSIGLLVELRDLLAINIYILVLKQWRLVQVCHREIRLCTSTAKVLGGTACAAAADPCRQLAERREGGKKREKPGEGRGSQARQGESELSCHSLCFSQGVSDDNCRESLDRCKALLHLLE